MHAVGPQIKEQLEAAKDPEIGEVVSAQLSSACGTKNESFSNFFLPLSFFHHLEFSKFGTKKSGLVGWWIVTKYGLHDTLFL